MKDAREDRSPKHGLLHGDYRRGAEACLPILPGAVLFGLATGAATVSAGVPPATAFIIPVAFYAGVAQLTYAQLTALAAPFASILLTMSATHLRYLVYATIASTWPRPDGRFFRLIAPYFISENAFAMALQVPPPARLRFMVGVGVPLWSVWVVTCIVGALLAGQLPPLKHAYAVPAIVLAPILAKQISGATRPIAAALALVLGLLLFATPLRLGPLISGSVAVAVILLSTRLLRWPR